MAILETSDLAKEEYKKQLHNELSCLFKKVGQGIQEHQEKIKKAKNGARFTNNRFAY